MQLMSSPAAKESLVERLTLPVLARPQLQIAKSSGPRLPRRDSNQSSTSIDCLKGMGRQMKLRGQIAFGLKLQS